MTTVENLRQELGAYRDKLKAQPKAVIIASETGPVGISIIERIVDAIGEIDARLTKLETQGK